MSKTKTNKRQTIVCLAIVMLAALGLLITAPFGNTANAAIAGAGAQAQCDSKHEGWTALSNDAIAYTDNVANVYLGGNVNLTQAITVEQGKTLNLCLGGFMLKQTAKSTRVITVAGTLNLYDCESGSTAAEHAHAYYIAKDATGADTGLYVFGDKTVANYDASYEYVEGTVQGGVLTGGFPPSEGAASLKVGGAVYLDSSATFNMYGGAIAGNFSPAGGGGLYLNSLSTFNMYGGAISGNLSEQNGGGAYIDGTFNLFGGSVDCNTAQYYGGGLYGGATITIGKSASVSGNKATNGGGVYQNSGSLFLNGGTVSANKATQTGGGIWSQSDTSAFTYITSGSIKGNTADSSGGLGGNGKFEFSAPIEKNAVIEISGNTVVKNGVASDDNFCLTMYGEAKVVHDDSQSVANYTFAGWYKDAGFVEIAPVYEKSTIYTDPIMLYAKTIPNNYTVNFDSNTGTGTMENQSFTYDETAKALTANSFTKTGYTFKEWNTAADGSGTSYTNSQNVQNLATSGTITLYAQWELAAYDIIYNLNGGTNADSNPATYTYISETITLADPTRAGYAFNSWTEGSSIATGSTGAKTFTATWTPNTYSVVFNSNTGAGTMENQSFTYDETAKALTANSFTKTGYIFKEWNTAQNGSGTSYTNSQAVQNLATSGTITLYAQWTALALQGGNNGKYDGNTDDKATLSFTTNADIDQFVSVKIGDTLLVKDKDYTLRAGSTIVTLTAEYLAGLTTGDYTVTITSTVGSVTANFSVVAQSTGLAWWAWVLIILGSLIAIYATLFVLWKFAGVKALSFLGFQKIDKLFSKKSTKN